MCVSAGLLPPPCADPPSRYDPCIVTVDRLASSAAAARASFVACRGGGIVLLALVVVAAVSAFVFRVSGSMPDFEVYRQAGERATAAEPLYRVEDGHYQFKYLPAFALLVAPLTALDPPAARAAWYGASIVLLPVLLQISVQLLPERRKPLWLLAMLTVVVMGKFYARELLLGQANLLFGVAVVGALLTLARARDSQGGILVALSIVLKPYGLILVPWLVAQRRWRAVGAAVVGLAVALLAPALVYGLDQNVTLHRAWWGTVVSTTAPNLANPDNVSWLAMYTRWAGEGTTAAALTLATVLVAAGAGLWMFRERRHVSTPSTLEGALMLVLVPFLSPQGWDYVVLVSTPAVMYLVNYNDRLPHPLRWLTILALGIVGLSIYDVMGREAYGAFMAASGVTLCYFVIIAAMITLRLRRVA